MKNKAGIRNSMIILLLFIGFVPLCGNRVWGAELGIKSAAPVFEDGLQVVSLIKNKLQEYEINVYLRKGIPGIPLKPLCQIFAIPLKEDQNKFYLTMGANRNTALDPQAKKVTKPDNRVMTVDLFIYNKQVYLPLQSAMDVTGIQLTWVPEEVRILASDSKLTKESGLGRDAQDQKGSRKTRAPFIPVYGANVSLSNNYQEVRAGGVTTWNETDLEIKTVGTILGGELVSDLIASRYNDEAAKLRVDKLYWRYDTEKYQWIVGTADMDYSYFVSYLGGGYPNGRSSLVGYEGKIAGVQFQNKPQEPAIGRQKPLAQGEVFYQLSAGTVYDTTNEVYSGFLSGATVNYGMTDWMNTEGDLYIFNNNSYNQNVYSLGMNLNPFPANEFYTTLANSYYQDDSLAVTDQSWRWGHHFKDGPWETFFDQYNYGRGYHPIMGIPLDMDGLHFGFRYGSGDRLLVGSFQTYTLNNSLDSDVRDEDQDISLYGRYRLSRDWQLDSEIAYSKSRTYTGSVLDDSLDSWDFSLELNQEIRPTFSMDYIYKYKVSEPYSDTDKETTHQFGLGFNWDQDSYLISFLPSYYREIDSYGDDSGYGEELKVSKGFLDNQLSLSYDQKYYQRVNGNEHQNISHNLSLNYSFPNQYRLALGAYWDWIHKLAATDMISQRYYISLNCPFGVSNGLFIPGLSPEELGKYGSIIITVFSDANQNGVKDPKEKTLGDIWVSLDSANYQKTDISGQVIYKMIKPGIHLVDFYQHKLDFQYSPTTLSQTVDVLPNNIYRIQLGLVEVGSLSGRVYVDKDGNGQYSEADQTQAGVKVLLDGFRETETTDDGSYYFDSVLTGKHQVTVKDGAEGVTFPELSVDIKSGAELTDQDFVGEGK